MIVHGEIISYLEMCNREGVNLQRGMNFRLKGRSSVILMSRRQGAPYADRIEDNGKILIYEGHDISRKKGGPDSKAFDQPMFHSGGKPTQNGLFYDAATRYRNGSSGDPEKVKVYEKIKAGIWVYSGVFRLINAWQETINKRKVFKFKFEILDYVDSKSITHYIDIDHNRLIPTSVKIEVWKRDQGKCVKCGKLNNLHFDHIIPYSKGGSSLVAENIQILCARHNIAKGSKLE